MWFSPAQTRLGLRCGVITVLSLAAFLFSGQLAADTTTHSVEYDNPQQTVTGLPVQSRYFQREWSNGPTTQGFAVGRDGDPAWDLDYLPDNQHPSFLLTTPVNYYPTAAVQVTLNNMALDHALPRSALKASSLAAAQQFANNYGERRTFLPNSLIPVQFNTLAGLKLKGYALQWQTRTEPKQDIQLMLLSHNTHLISVATMTGGVDQLPAIQAAVRRIIRTIQLPAS